MCLEPEVSLPFSSLAQNVLGRRGGWGDRQLPDGTVTWTAPGGQTHTTRPGSHLLFPSLCAPTAPVPATATATRAAVPNTGLTMPRRTATRAENRTRRIDEERRLNETDPQREHPDYAPPF